MFAPSNGPSVVVFTLKMVNSGFPNSATDWKMTRITPGGQEIESYTGSPGQETIQALVFVREFHTRFGDVSNMRPDRNFITMFELNNFAIQIGGITTGWIAFPIKGTNSIQPGTKFTISFRDALNRTVSVTHPYVEPFSKP
jgi:hypothetical protein